MSDMTIQEACNLTDQFGRFLKGLARLQEAAAALRGAEQLIAERTARAEALASQIAQAEARLAAITAQAEGAAAKAASDASDASDAVQKLMAEARANAASIEAEAKKHDEKIRAEAGEVISRANAAERQRQDAERELAAIHARIELAKEEARKIFGGA